MTTTTATATPRPTTKKPAAKKAPAAAWTHPTPAHMPEHAGLNAENPRSWAWRRESKRAELAAISREDLMFDAVNVAFTNGWDDRYTFTHKSPTEDLIACLLENAGFGVPAELLAQVDEAWAELPDDKPALIAVARERGVKVSTSADAEALITALLEAMFGPELVALYYETYE